VNASIPNQSTVSGDFKDITVSVTVR
jgi:hypothetical protein